MGLSKLVAVAIGSACAAALPDSPRAAGAAQAPLVAPDTSTGPVQVPPVGRGERANGAVFVGYRGTDGWTTGAVATLAPWWRSFIRLGAEATPRSPDGDARFLWGVGFEHWRERTFFLHVHDWGPVRSVRSFDVRNAEASFGYKLPVLRGGPFRVAASPFATVPFEGGPYAGARIALIVGRTWFVSPSFAWTVPGVLPGSADPPQWRFSAALGRWDGRPGGLFITYRDDLSPQQYHNWRELDRQGRGVLALGVNWAY